MEEEVEDRVLMIWKLVMPEPEWLVIREDQ